MTKAGGRPRVDDSWLYDTETVRIGVLLFGARPCTDCGLPLPACSDYFSPSKNGDGFAHLKSACKRCTAARYRGANRQRKQRGRDEAKAVRLVHDLCVRTSRMLDLRGLVRP